MCACVWHLADTLALNIKVKEETKTNVKKAASEVSMIIGRTARVKHTPYCFLNTNSPARVFELLAFLFKNAANYYFFPGNKYIFLHSLCSHINYNLTSSLWYTCYFPLYLFLLLFGLKPNLTFQLPSRAAELWINANLDLSVFYLDGKVLTTILHVLLYGWVNKDTYTHIFTYKIHSNN